MKIFVNNKEIEIYRGATIESAVRKFDKTMIAGLRNNQLEVVDEYGNHVSTSGRLTENDKIFIKKTS